MSIQDRIAKRLIVGYSNILSSNLNGWLDILHRTTDIDRSAMDSASINVLINNVKLACEVASDEKSQVVGLQKYASLPDGYGMIFPYSPPRTVSFHMGSVSFPIDIMFVGIDNRITKIVPNILPGTRGMWGMSHVAAVIEASGGFAEQNEVGVGSLVSIDFNTKLAQEKFPNYPRKDVNPAPTNTNSTIDRFKNRDLVDVQVSNQQSDPAHYTVMNGYDPMANDNLPMVRSSHIK